MKNSTAEKIGDGIAAAMNIAKASGSAIMRLHRDVDVAPDWPAAHLLGEAAKTTAVMLWADGRDELSYFCLGQTKVFDFAGDNRFDDADLVCKGLASLVIDIGLGDGINGDELPVAVGGFAFSTDQRDSARPDQEPWRGWGDGELWIPEVLIQRHRGYAHAWVTLEVKPNDESKHLQEYAQTALSNLDSLLSTLARPKQQEPLTQETPLCAFLSPTSYRHRRRIQRPEYRARTTTAEQDAATATKNPREQFCQRVEAAKATIIAGEIDKVVLARAAHLQLNEGEDFDPHGTARQLRAQYPGCKTFALSRQDAGTFVGASPELFRRKRATGGGQRARRHRGTRPKHWRR